MKDCVIFAAWTPHKHRIQSYIDVIKKSWLDCDFFVGINPSSHPEFEQQLREIGINNIIHVKPELTLNSDASAFQAALRLYKESHKDYRNVFFMHTKGMSYQTNEQWKLSRESYFDDFATRRPQLEKLLEPDDVGGCGLVSNFCWSLHYSGYIKSITQYVKTPYKNVLDVMWLTTHYAIKNECVKYFVENCNADFFTTNLADRYYFESSFPLIVELTSGKKRECCVYWDDNIEQNYKKLINEWTTRIKENI